MTATTPTPPQAGQAKHTAEAFILPEWTEWTHSGRWVDLPAHGQVKMPSVAHARSVVESVNACRGLNPAQLRAQRDGLLAACEIALRRLGQLQAEENSAECGPCPACTALRAAIAGGAA